jgi:hypothetical protein
MKKFLDLEYDVRKLALMSFGTQYKGTEGNKYALVAGRLRLLNGEPGGIVVAKLNKDYEFEPCDENDDGLEENFKEAVRQANAEIEGLIRKNQK